MVLQQDVSITLPDKANVEDLGSWFFEIPDKTTVDHWWR